MTPRDDHSRQPEDALRAVLRSRADEVSPAPDAYARLAVRVADLDAGRGRWWWQPRWAALPVTLCLLAAAVAVVLMAGGDPGGQRIDTITAPTTAPPATGEVPGEGAGGGTARATPLFPGDDPAAWFATADEAGRAFVATILDEPELVLGPASDGRMPVRARGEGGTPTDPVGSLLVVEDRASDGRSRFAIAGAEVDSITIGTPASGSSATSPLLVSGTSSSYEGALHITIRAMDGTVLGTGSAQGGAGADLEPFRAEVDLDGTGLAFVVVSAEGVADGATGRHAAVPVDIAHPSTSDSYVVVRVQADDPDGGLVVRSAAAPGAAPVGVLAPAATGIRRTGPTAEGWWRVTDGSVEGWVNSRYLALDVPLDADRADELQRLAADTARAVADRDADLLAALPWDELRPVLVGWAGAPDQVPAATLADAGFWSSPRTFRLPDAFAPATVEATFFDYVDRDRSGQHPVGVDDCCLYGVSDRAEVRGLRHGSFRSGSDSTDGWTVTRLYADWTSGQLRIAAVLVERWEP